MSIEKIKSLKRLDTFYIQYGFSIKRFIVKNFVNDGVIVTSPTFLKSSNFYLSFGELKRMIEVFKFPFWVGKPYSKLRWFLKF